MKTINETIAQAITESIYGNEGRFDVEVEVDENTVVEVSGWYEADGYCEDDYFNGTGAWVTTYVRVSVESCEVFAYDEDGNEVAPAVMPDLAEVERIAEYLAA